MMKFVGRFLKEERGDVIQWVVVVMLALGFTIFVMSAITSSEDKSSPANQLVNWVKNTVSCVTTNKPLDGMSCS